MIGENAPHYKAGGALNPLMRPRDSAILTAAPALLSRRAGKIPKALAGAFSLPSERRMPPARPPRAGYRAALGPEMEKKQHLANL
jgi:hypothetical protein